jgi:uncharacterized membrane protein YgcG
VTIVAILLLAAVLFILVGRWRRASPGSGRTVDADRRRDDGIVILPIDAPTTGDDLSSGGDAFTPGGGDFGGAGSSGGWDSSSDGGGGDGGGGGD